MRKIQIHLQTKVLEFSLDGFYKKCGFACHCREILHGPSFCTAFAKKLPDDKRLPECIESEKDRNEKDRKWINRIIKMLKKLCIL